jgi:hypothetical protein
VFFQEDFGIIPRICEVKKKCSNCRKMFECISLTVKLDMQGRALIFIKLKNSLPAEIITKVDRYI